MPRNRQTNKSSKPYKKPTQDRSQFTVDAIVEAAIQVFEEYGYAAGTTTRIAERAGVSIGSLYQYFPNKDSILVAIAEHHLEECQIAAMQLLTKAQNQPQTLETAIRLFVEGAVTLHTQNPKLHQLLSEEIPLPESIWQEFEALEQELVNQITQLLSLHPQVTTRNIELSAYVVVQIVEAMAHKLVLHPSNQHHLTNCIDEIVLILLRYLSNEQTSI
ncbi:TetR/AcrR family transcriptional regulator [Leptolyngbya sp. AN03gr2]|uniref:TetR/AcrR family transcriptional regulator n=1 Tax=unclassified Leptolyngbya TaxID=2650499 RepID=UPI003D31FA80